MTRIDLYSRQPVVNTLVTPFAFELCGGLPAREWLTPKPIGNAKPYHSEGAEHCPSRRWLVLPLLVVIDACLYHEQPCSAGILRAVAETSRLRNCDCIGAIG